MRGELRELPEIDGDRGDAKSDGAQGSSASSRFKLGYGFRVSGTIRAVADITLLCESLVMASAMAGLIAQPCIVQACFPALNSPRIPRQRVSCSLGLTSSSGFGKDPITSGKSYVRASSSSVPLQGNEPSLDLGGGGNGAGLTGSGSGSGGGGGGGDSYGKGESEGGSRGGILGAFWKGWNDRVRADPQFPFKVLTEEVVGVGACVLGDMLTRPNFGMNELDFVFCTLVVGSIVNFSLMYVLAPTSVGAVATHLPGIFASCPSGHMFESGTYSLLDRAGTFAYKGAQFAVVGFAAGLVGTAVSNTLLAVRKKMDPDFVAQNTPPPTLLNAATWALQLGLSSNSRYQILNGLEFTLASKLPPSVFKTGVLVVRALNNVVGGMSFVAIARITGSQKASPPPVPPAVASVQEKLVESVDEVADKTVGSRA